jgi:hypothetical protein
MDPLSVSASIIAVLQISCEVIKYLKDVKDANDDCQRCLADTSNLHGLLISLLPHIQQTKTGDPWFTSVEQLASENGVIDQFSHVLQKLHAKVQIPDGARGLKKRLLWKFDKTEVANMQASMDRLKSLITLALQLDHL